MTSKRNLVVLGLTLSITALNVSAAISAEGSKVLTGGVQKVELSLERLRDVGLDLKQIMSSSRHLYDEVNIQPVSMIMQPSMIGPGTIINIPIGTMPTGPVQQPRKSRVDSAMATMTPIIRKFKMDADDFVTAEKQIDVPAEVHGQIEPLLKTWIADIGQISNQLTQLEQLTPGPTYDNGSISNVCKQMQNTAQDLDKVRSKAFKILKKQHRK